MNEIKENKRILFYKKRFNSEQNKPEFKRFETQEKEIISFEELTEEAKYFPFNSYQEMLNNYSKKNMTEFISTIIWDNEIDGTVLLKGDNTKSKFLLAKNLRLKYYDIISNNRGFGRLKVRKHEEKVFFIEEFKPFRKDKKENYKRVCELRSNYTLDEWKNILLGSIGCDLSDSESITRDLLLVRMLPYVEKNYNYIELGGMATGKTTMTEMFNTSEKISSTISPSNLIYNSIKKEHGMLFNKDVLYLDETNFSKLDKDVAPALLQAKSGNRIEVRGKYDSKASEASFVSQGNIMNPIAKFTEKKLLEDLKKGFNIPAHFDRECFFLAGWLIPSYQNMAIKDDTLGLRLDVLEDFLSVLREESSYHNLISNLKIDLKGSKSTTRFKDQILRTVSGFLKLFNPNKDQELDKQDKEKITALSVYGKYLIQESAFDLGEDNFENDYVTYYFEGINKKKITRQSLKSHYIGNKEHKYFTTEDEVIEELEESPYTINIEKETIHSNIEMKIDKVDIPDFLIRLLKELKIYSDNSKVLTHYRYVLAYQYSNQTKNDKSIYLENIIELLCFMLYVYAFFEINDSSKIILLKELTDRTLSSISHKYIDDEVFLENTKNLGVNIEYLLSMLKLLKEYILKAEKKFKSIKLDYNNETNFFKDLGLYETKRKELDKYKFNMKINNLYKSEFTEPKEGVSGLIIRFYNLKEITIDVRNLPLDTKSLVLSIEFIYGFKCVKEYKVESIFYFPDNKFNLETLSIDDGIRILKLKGEKRYDEDMNRNSNYVFTLYSLNDYLEKELLEDSNTDSLLLKKELEKKMLSSILKIIEHPEKTEEDREELKENTRYTNEEIQKEIPKNNSKWKREDFL